MSVRPYRLDADELEEKQDKSLKTAKLLSSALDEACRSIFSVPPIEPSFKIQSLASSAGSAGWHILPPMSGQLLPAFQGHLLGSTAMYTTN